MVFDDVIDLPAVSPTPFRALPLFQEHPSPCGDGSAPNRLSPEISNAGASIHAVHNPHLLQDTPSPIRTFCRHSGHALGVLHSSQAQCPERLLQQERHSTGITLSRTSWAGWLDR